MYNFEYSFLTRLSQKIVKQEHIRKIWLAPLVLFGLPFYAVFCIMTISKWHILSDKPALFISILIASLWLIIAPVILVSWDLSFKKFHDELKSYISSSTNFKKTGLTKVYFKDGFYRYFLSCLFIVFFCAAVASGMDEYKKIGLNPGYDAPVFWLAEVLAVSAGFAVGYGIWSSFKSIYTIFIIRRYYDVKWEMFSADGLGGLSFMYRFILGTTFSITSATLVIPSWLMLISNSSLPVRLCSYALIVVYSISISCSYIIPARIINAIIRRKIESSLSVTAKKLNSLPHTEERSGEFLVNIEIMRYLENYDLAPLDMGRILKFTASFIVPILLLAIEIGKKFHFL